MSKLAYYRNTLGFDESYHIAFTRTYKIQCGQCEALVINGIPTHEHGCSNATHECNGCYARIPTNQRYCEECQS